MRRQPFPLRQGVALLVLWLMLPRALHAQRRGFSVTGDLEVAQPSLGQRETDFWSGGGTFGAGVGADLGVDYDWSRVGLSLEGNGARTSLGTLPGDAFGLAMLINWHPNVAFHGWHPRAAFGVVMMQLGDVWLLPSQVRTDFLEPPSTGGSPSQVEKTTMFGSGPRLMLAGERALNDWSALRVLVGADFVAFGDVKYAGQEFTLRGADLSNYFRLGIGLRIYPRWGHSPPT